MDQLPINSGILVLKILENSKADNSQLRNGDVIVGINAVPVGSVDELYLQMNEELIHRQVQLDVLRKGVKIAISAMLGEA